MPSSKIVGLKDCASGGAGTYWYCAGASFTKLYGSDSCNPTGMPPQLYRSPIVSFSAEDPSKINS